MFKINTLGNGKNFSDNDYARFDFNTAVKCTAQPNSGFVFRSWSGDVAYNKKRYSAITFKLSSGKTMTANFNNLPPPPVTVFLPKEFMTPYIQF